MFTKKKKTHLEIWRIREKLKKEEHGSLKKMRHVQATMYQHVAKKLPKESPIHIP